MAAGARFVWNAGWEQRVLDGPEGMMALHKAGEAAKEAIDAAVPVVTGAYKSHFDMGLRVEPGADGRRARIIITEPRWHIIEHGSVKNQPYAPISKGTEGAGLRFERT